MRRFAWWPQQSSGRPLVSLLSLLAVSALSWGAKALHAEPLTLARVHYDGGGDWYSDPTSLPNLQEELNKRLGIETSEREAVVKLEDPQLFRYPYLYLTGHGNLRFSDAEMERLRSYLAAGGFLHVDDNYGLDESFRREMSRLYPDSKLQVLPADHPVYRMFYQLDGLPKVHEHDNLPAQGLAIFRGGRMVIFYSYQSDLGDGWESPEVHQDSPELREAAFQMATNLFLYALNQ